MTVVTPKEEMESIQKELDDVGKAQIIVLVGEPGSGKTWIAGQIIDEATRRGKLSGALWFYLNKKYDGESLLLDIAYQLSLLSTRRLLEDEAENEEAKVDKEELKRKKEQEMSLFWAAEVWEDEEENEKEKEEGEKDNERKEKAGEEKQEVDSSKISANMIVNKSKREKGKEGEEEEDDEEKKKKKEEEKKKERVTKLRQKVFALLTTKKYILVLDGYKYDTMNKGDGLTEEKLKKKLNPHFREIMSELETSVETKVAFPKILITARGEGSGCSHNTSVDLSTRADGDGITSDTGKGEGQEITQVEEHGDEGRVVEHGESRMVRDSSKKWGTLMEEHWSKIEVIPLSEAHCESLFQKRFPTEFSSLPRWKDLIKAIHNSSKGLPSAVLVIAETLRHVVTDGHQTWTLERAIDRVIRKSGLSDSERDLFRCGYDMLPDIDIANCCWYSRQLFIKRGAVHFNELISYWIMEGLLGTDSINKNYTRGYFVLKELMKRKMFKIREDNLVAMEEKALEVTDDRDHDIGGTSSLGLVNIFEKKEWGGLGRIALSDGMLKTPCNRKAWQMVPTVLMDESCLCRHVPEDLFIRMKGLQVLVLLKPILLDKLPPSLYKLEKLQILVLRGCELLCDVEQISEVRSLGVLEISGADRLKKVPDNLFENLTNLRCLNLSKSGIENLPSPPEDSQGISFSSALRWLILRGCPNLKELPSLRKFKELQVIDLSGSTSFEKVKDNFFTSLTKLQMVDFSNTLIKAFPIVGALEELKRLFFRNCKNLNRLPRFPPKVKCLDLSGCTHFLEFRNETLKDKSDFETLDLSQTEIASLPSVPMPEGLFHLGLRNFSKIKKFSSKTPLTQLELLDLSKGHKLDEIDLQSFLHLTCIQVLKLSETQIKTLPSLDALSSLHELFLSGCMNLTELPKIDTLTELEVLDLSGCTALTCLKLQDFAKQSRLLQLSLSGAYKLKEFDATTLKHMTLLQKLDLSENPSLEELSGMSNLSDLRQLSLKGCSSLKNFCGGHEDFMVDFEKLTKLEVLDLSGINLGSLGPTLLSKFSKLEELQLSGATIKEFPYGVFEMTCLKRLSLPDSENIDWGRIKHVPEELSFDQHGIFTIATPGSATRLMVAVCWIKQHSEDELFNRYQQELARVFQDLRYSLPNGAVPLEVHGFRTPPASCKTFFNLAKYLSFTDTSSSSLSSLGGDADAVKDMKGSWLDRCPNMKYIVSGERADAALENLEILWISNLPHLLSLCSEDLKFNCFEKLTHLYLDCCPMLEHVFSLHNVPGQLKVLEIRFCDNLKSLFEKSDGTFQFTLEKLVLFALPEFSIRGELTPNQIGKVFVKDCPKLLSGVENTELRRSWTAKLNLGEPQP